MSDRIRSISTQSMIQKSAYDKIDKNFRGIAHFSEMEQMQIIEKSALETIIDASELLTTVREEMRRALR